MPLREEEEEAIRHPQTVSRLDVSETSLEDTDVYFLAFPAAFLAFNLRNCSSPVRPGAARLSAAVWLVCLGAMV
jgi:hypothetical protein